MDFFATLATTLAQDTAAAAPPGPTLVDFLLPIAIVFVLYTLLIGRPNRRAQMERENQLSALKKGDRVVTIGGICGKVASVDKEGGKVTLQIDKGVKMTFLKSAINEVTQQKGEKKKKDAEDEDKEE